MEEAFYQYALSIWERPLHNSVLRVLNLLQQSADLAIAVGLLTFLNGWFGWGVSFVGLPRWYRIRWFLVAPIVGVAIQAVVLTPFSLWGWPLRDLKAGMFLFSAAVNLSVLVYVGHNKWARADARRSLIYTRHILLPSLFLMTVLVVMSASLITHAGAGSVRDAWGSGDYQCYWIFIDYLQNHGGTFAAYSAQEQFACHEIDLHLTVWARLGSMCYLGFFASWYRPEEPFRAINPAIIAAMWSLVSLCWCLLERQRVHRVWPLIVLTLHPFLWFLLFFTYFGQAVAVPIVLLTMILTRTTIASSIAHRPSTAAACLSGLMLGACLLSYPGSCPVFAVFFAGVLVWLIRVQAPYLAVKSLLVIALIAIALSGYYLPRVLQELAYVNRQQPMPGWNWRSLIGFGEFLGVYTTLGYDLPHESLASRSRLLKDAVACLAIMLVIAAGMRSLRDKWFYAIILLSTIGLAIIALIKVWQEIPNATHGFVKVISQFAVVLLVPVLTSISKIFSRCSRKQRVVLATSLFIWILCEIRADSYGMLHRPWYGADLVDLVQRNLNSPAKLVILPEKQWWRKPEAIAIVRNEHRLLDLTPELAAFTTNSYSRVLACVDSTYADSDGVFDRQGKYLLVQPPRMINLKSDGGQRWVLSGIQSIAIPSPIPFSVLLGKAGRTIEIDFEMSAGQLSEPINHRNEFAKYELVVNGSSVLQFTSSECSKGISAVIPDLLRPTDGANYSIVQVRPIAVGSEAQSNPSVLDQRQVGRISEIRFCD